MAAIVGIDQGLGVQSMIAQDPAALGKGRGSFLEHLYGTRIPVVGIAILLVLLPLAATRAGLTTADTDIYIRVFEEYEPVNGLFGGDFAPAFTALSWLAKSCRLDVAGYFWIVAGFGVTLRLIGIHRSSHFFLASVLVYLSKYFLLHEFAQVRAGIASAIFLCAIPYLAARKPWRYLLSIMAAAAFHPSAFLYLLVYPLGSQYRNNNRWLMWTVLGGGFVYLLNFNGALFTMLAQIFPKIEVYIDLLAEGQYSEINLLNVEVIIRIAIWLVLYGASRELRGHFRYFDVLFRVWTLSLISYFAFSSVPVFAFRTSELFDVVSIPLLPALLVAFRIRLIGFASFALVLGAFVINFYLIQPIIL